MWLVMFYVHDCENIRKHITLLGVTLRTLTLCFSRNKDHVTKVMVIIIHGKSQWLTLIVALVFPHSTIWFKNEVNTWRSSYNLGEDHTQRISPSIYLSRKRHGLSTICVLDKGR